MNRSQAQHSRPITRLLGATASVLLAWSMTLNAAASESLFPVRVSANGRYLVDASGKPFLLHGDTAWSLMVQLTREETEEYLENRRQKGFNSIIVNLIEYYFASDPPKNVYGDGPFTTPGDFSTPVEAYFAHADRVLSKAAEKGILVLLNPAYLGNHATPDGWWREVEANGPTKCRNYGRYLGRRYKDYSNIIWVAGGDQTPSAGSAREKNWLEILLGIKDHAPGHLWTAHWSPSMDSLDVVAFRPNMDLNGVYSYGTFTTTGLGTVLRWDGTRWQTEPVRVDDGILSLAGETVTVFSSGKSQSPAIFNWPPTRKAVLSYQWRRPGGQWEGPVTLVPEFKIAELRSMPGFSVPRYSPPNFVPLAWSDAEEGLVKFLRVPIPQQPTP